MPAAGFSGSTWTWRAVTRQNGQSCPGRPEDARCVVFGRYRYSRAGAHHGPYAGDPAPEQGTAAAAPHRRVQPGRGQNCVDGIFCRAPRIDTVGPVSASSGKKWFRPEPRDRLEPPE